MNDETHKTILHLNTSKVCPTASDEILDPATPVQKQEGSQGFQRNKS